jgi:hypothetical protein
MSNRIARVQVTSTPGKGRHVILETANTSVNTGPPVIAGVTALQVLGAFSGAVQVDCPAQASGACQDLSFVQAITPGIPNNFTLTPNSSGLIQASAFLIALPDDSNIVLSCPALSLTFGTGPPQQAGSGTWTLVPSVNYQGPVVNGSIRAYSATATSDNTLTLVVEALLLGISATT